jgi:hypothetical protein
MEVNRMHLRELRIAPDNQIEHEMYLVDLPSLPVSEALVMKFIGTYGYGSSGNGDARYMIAVTKAAIEYSDPDALIFDFSQLRYAWGDMLGAVLTEGYRLWGDEDVPHAIVVSDLCEPAIRSLLSDDLLLEASDFVLRDLHDAVNQVDRILVRRRNKLLG